MPGYEFQTPCPELAEVVEAIWHADFPDADAARSLVLPVVSPILCFHYRSAPLLRLGSADIERLIDPGGYRMTGICSAAARIQSNGPVGGVMVRLRPEGAARLRGICVREFAEDAFSLADVFSSSEVSELDERLSEAETPSARIEAVQRLLLARLSERELDPLVVAGACALRRRPSFAIRDLARLLDVGERHFSRRFHDALGTSPKRFARILRFGAAVRSARAGARWAHTAAACGFADQAHLVNEFTSMVGMPPDTLFKTTSLALDRPNPSTVESEFFNTFVAQFPTSA